MGIGFQMGETLCEILSHNVRYDMYVGAQKNRLNETILCNTQISKENKMHLWDSNSQPSV